MTYFTETHEYVRVEGEFGYIGITDYAQQQLGNIVYVDLPDVDDEVTKGEEFGAVEGCQRPDVACNRNSGRGERRSGRSSGESKRERHGELDYQGTARRQHTAERPDVRR